MIGMLGWQWVENLPIRDAVLKDRGTGGVGIGRSTVSVAADLHEPLI